MQSDAHAIIRKLKEACRTKAEHTARLARPALVAEMRERGVNEVRVSFASPGKEAEIRDRAVTDVPVSFSRFGDEGEIFDTFVKPDGVVLPKKFENWIDGFLAGTGVNWRRIEGGWGTLTFDLVANIFAYEVNGRRSDEGASGQENL